MEIRSETRTAETPGIDVESNPLYSIRWSAIFAGLAVGLGVHLLLMLIGVSAGLAVFGAGERPEGQTISVAAAVWNTISMLVSAFVGGYVAARASGLRRTSDGMLHGVVSWGATVMVVAFLTGSVTGNALGGMFGLASTTAATQAAAPGSPGVSIPELLTSIQSGDRAATVAMLQERFGMTPEQANRVADQAATMIGQGQTAPGMSEQVTDTAQAASAASVWLAAAILLSLLSAAGGGLMGAHGAQRRATPVGMGKRHVTTRTVRREVPTAG